MRGEVEGRVEADRLPFPSSFVPFFVGLRCSLHRQQISGRFFRLCTRLTSVESRISTLGFRSLRFVDLSPSSFPPSSLVSVCSIPSLLLASCLRSDTDHLDIISTLGPFLHPARPQTSTEQNPTSANHHPPRLSSLPLHRREGSDPTRKEAQEEQRRGRRRVLCWRSRRWS
ncbi:hypothetical protein BDY24DRAFT_150134 [Mrakia frigida]|uniref:uncharacterized protein n=1 Tax=Mrakia frigida TaxID=29902 RepID=UPI003FCC1954